MITISTSCLSSDATLMFTSEIEERMCERDQRRRLEDGEKHLEIGEETRKRRKTETGEEMLKTGVKRGEDDGRKGEREGEGGWGQWNSSNGQPRLWLIARHASS
jgi:hypothetical protein